MALPGALNFPEGTTPSTPAAGRRKLYPKSDGWYQVDSAGTEAPIANGVASVGTADGTLVNGGTATARTLKRAPITGDVAIPDASNTATLASVGPGATGPLGGASVAPIVTIDAKGRVTALTSATITPAAIGAPAGSGTSVGTHSGSSSGTNTGDQTITLSGAVTGTGTGAITTTRGTEAANTVLANATAGVATPTAFALAASTFLARAAAGNITAAAITAVGFAMLAATDASAQTALINVASATLNGLQSTANFKKQRDEFTDLVNDLGCDPTGSVDATSIIQTWINGLANSGVGYIKPDCRIRVDGPVNVTKEVRFLGGERRTSIIGTGNATNTQFDVTADGCVFENLRFEAGTTAQNLSLRSAGYCVDVDATSNGSGFYKVDVIGHWSSINLEGQLGFVDDCNIREYGALAGSGQCIRVNTPGAGGDTIIRRVLTDNGSNIAGWAGIRVIQCASLIIDACNIIHATENLCIQPANAGTVPSLKVSNSFFDTGTYGLRFNPTGTGVWYRSEFINCWFGSNSVAGIAFSSAQFDGIVFTNCDILGNPVGVDANAGGGSWTLNGGCQIAGASTAGIRLAASAGHFPVIQGNRIRPQAVGGAFGVNAVGIIIGAGTYLGCVIQNNDVSGNTSPATIGAVTVADWKNYRITDNTGINPRGSALAVTTPAVPATTVAATNTTGSRVLILMKCAATAPTAYNINGVAIAHAMLASQVVPITLEPGGTVSYTGTSPTWVWVGQ